MKRQKRGWSNEFPTGTKPNRKIGVDWVPARLLRAVRAKAKRQGVSVRVILLRYLTSWVEEPDKS